MSLPSEIDVAIIGAGAAGIGAARALEGKGLSVLMLEARDRLGGRAFTAATREQHHLRRRLRLAAFGRQEQVRSHRRRARFRDRPRPSALEPADLQPRLSAGGARGVPEGDGRVLRSRRGRRRARHRSAGERIAACPAIAGTRCSTASPPTSTASSSIACRSSTWTPTRTPRFNWRSKRGYGALVAAYGAPCPVAFDAKVTLIDHSSPRIRIETSRGTIDRVKSDRHRADQPDRKRDGALSPRAAGEGRSRARPAAGPRRQGDAGAR